MADQEFAEIPVQIVGLQKDDIESRKAELKFQRSLQAFGRIHHDIIEARAIVKTSLLEKERRRYEVQLLTRPHHCAMRHGISRPRSRSRVLVASRLPYHWMWSHANTGGSQRAPLH